jgi:cholesterol oxidase
MARPEQFDAVVVGSGFGGAVAGYRLAEAGRRTCVLERGKAYPPGSFARTPREMARNFWDPSEGGHGLYQVWAFPGIESVVSAGLGGGSLIYANVLIRKDERWFVREDLAKGGFEHWPVTRDELDPDYDAVEKILAPQRYPFHAEPYRSTPKTNALREAAERAGLQWFLPELAVTFANPGRDPTPGELIVDEHGWAQDNYHHRPRYTCRLVGECDVGCNFGSKNSLDYNYLTLAQREKAEIRTRCEVRSFEPRPGGGFLVRYVVHEPRREHRKTDTSRLPLVEIATDRLILSAGVFGTTYLLLKNRRAFPKLGPLLGTRFGGNGDLLGFVRRQRTGRDLDPMSGPVITSGVRVEDALDAAAAGGRGGEQGAGGRGYYVEEGGFPAFAGWALEGSDSPGELRRFVRFLARGVQRAVRRDPRSDLSGEMRQLLGEAGDSAGTMVLLGMGRDVPDGRFGLHGKWLDLDWKIDASQGYFERVRGTMARVARELDADFAVNPLWYLRKLVTVHGLGGCPMGRSPDEGVVDSYGQVFGYPGLYVADGSVMPGPVGANPALTIAALANRFASRMIEQERGSL